MTQDILVPASVSATSRRLGYPEMGAGGFSHVDGTIQFYSRINALLAPDHTVVDLGAGRGAFLEDTVAYRRELRRLQGKVRRVIGLDVDPAVLANPSLDEAHVLEPNGGFPLADASVDLMLSDFTFEHIESPEHVAAEIGRVLRPGGWLCARTPNKRGYIALGARVVPNQLHKAALRRLQPSKQERDTFPTRYRMNAVADLRRLFPEESYDHFTYAADNEPAYAGSSAAAWRLADGILHRAPRPYRSMLYIFIQRRLGPPEATRPGGVS
ncbi:methyltransferase domain-containing protein [Sporichthya sp.]|uniref:class I SAM-dependent methyltransferase n=1 Tax=Sporichthya sp. TaxID=65475 RepID=UPI0017B0C620|nr:methyltransferase domain-containing protein [Sporichthya sp.]MBA3741940.1 methyltransferase domain-containing protein [Sporichthya sp.]